jgi:hypothetical protein
MIVGRLVSHGKGEIMAATIEALRGLVERGSRDNPHLMGRLEKAAFIVLLRPIESLGESTYRVVSEDALKSYIVQNGQCECPDYVRHGNGHFCKHRLAVGMLVRLNGRKPLKGGAPV